MKKRYLVGLAVLMSCVISVGAEASPIYSPGAGNSVTTTNYSATFDNITTGTSLLGYTEDNLIVSVDDSAFTGWSSPGAGFDGSFHYGNFGNASYVSVSTANSEEITGLEFLIGHGWNSFSGGYMAWEIYDDTSLVGSGNSGFIQKGTVVGWSDSNGFDELRVGFSYDSNYSLGGYQTIALDNLRVQTAPVPEPATMLLMGTGLAGLLGARRKKNK